MSKPGQQSTHCRDGVLFLPAASGTSAGMERIWIHRMGVERVRDGALKETFSRTVERLRRSEVIVELLQRCEKAIDLHIPRQRRGVVPSLFALRDRERPVKKIAHMRENLRRRARLVADMEGAKVIRRAAQRFSAAVSNGRKRVAQKLASRIGRRGDGRASHR